MAAEDNFIVAIELGSSKVTGLAGRKQPDGAIQVLAFVQEPSFAFIRKGRIFNVDKMTQCICNLKEKLEKTLKKSISQVYVGIGGMGMHTVGNSVVRNFNEKTVISQEIIDEILDTNLNASSPNREILDVQPQEYKLGTQLQTDPVGVYTDHIEGRFLNIMASSTLREQVENCFHMAGVAIADMPITVKELADAILTEAEKRSGCVFVDMGAETTSVAVYKNNLLRHLAVIPLGGANITRDIMTLNIEEDEAESLKIAYGSALTEQETTEHAPVSLRDGRTIKFEELCDLIEARTEEIILNIDNQIKLSKYDKNQLIGGIIITGGAANIRNVEKAIGKHTGFEKLRFVKNLRIALRTGMADFNKDGSCNAALSLLEKGDRNCCGGDIGANPVNLFPTEEELKAKREKEEKARREAEEKKRQEEEEKARREAEEQERREAEEREAAKRKKREAWKSKWKNLVNFAGRFVSEGNEDRIISSDKEDQDSSASK